MTGKAATACEYGDNTSLNNLHVAVKKHLLKNDPTKAQIQEDLRKSFVFNMMHGKVMVINCDSMVPALNEEYDCKDLPLKDVLFDTDKMYDKEGKYYKVVVKQAEDKSK